MTSNLGFHIWRAEMQKCRSQNKDLHEIGRVAFMMTILFTVQFLFVFFCLFIVVVCTGVFLMAVLYLFV